jgi:Zn-dependent M28 family amino/carboxypeptidase
MKIDSITVAFILSLLLPAKVATAQLAVDSNTVLKDIRGWMEYLSSDRLKGRVEGSPQNREVTDSIASYFAELGLEPYLASGLLHTFYTDDLDSSITTSNVIGVLRGSEKPDEYIVLSAHFDHVQVGFYHKTDKIYNGANDNASGTSVMLAIARQLVLTGPHKRSIVFCAFNAEEAGLIGSADFAGKINADQIIAGINLEMLGYPQYGRKAVMLTGMFNSDLYKLFRKRAEGASIRFRRERGDLFERSDNYSLAKKGIPAHTIMASDDREPCYHRPCDELKRMNLPNMAVLAQGIIHLMEGLTDGSETPTRIRVR